MQVGWVHNIYIGYSVVFFGFRIGQNSVEYEGFDWILFEVSIYYII